MFAVADTVVAAWVSAGALIVVAVVSGFSALLVKRLDRTNHEQHGASLSILEGIRDDVDEIKSAVLRDRGRLLDHYQWHANNKPVDEPVDIGGSNM